MNLTRPELGVVLYAMQSIGDDLDEVGLSPDEKRAYHRAKIKINLAYRVAAVKGTE